MFTDWLYRINVITPTSEKENKNALWTIVAPNGDAEAETFGVDLSPNGQEPVTHGGISTAATEEMKLFIEYVFVEELEDAIISVQDYRENDFDELLIMNGLQRVGIEEIL